MNGAVAGRFDASDMCRQRVGLLVHGPDDLGLLVRLLDSLGAGIDAQIVLVVRVVSGAPPPGRGDRLVDLFTRFDVRRNRARLREQAERTAVRLEAFRPTQLEAAPEPAPADLEVLQAADLDLLLTGDPNGAAAWRGAARLGVWAPVVATSDGGLAPVGDRGLVFDAPALLEVAIAVFEPGDTPPAVHNRVTVDGGGPLSGVRLREQILLLAAHALTWTLRQSGLPPIRSAAPAAPVRLPPGAHAHAVPVASVLTRRLLRHVAQRLRRRPEREWQVGLGGNTGDLPWSMGTQALRWLAAPAGQYLADPFLFEQDDATWLFAEAFDYAADKGKLVCAKLDGGSGALVWRDVLDAPYHLSFPFVFAHDGAIWLVPESSAAGRVDLYRCERFPDDWRFATTLWDQPGLDTVPYRAEDGSWYFFTTLQPHKRVPPQLLLFTAATLGAPWRPHPGNPLSMDMRYARSAGRILEIAQPDGGRKRLRVSQDGVGGYGRQLHFHEIVALDAERYEERWAGTRLPPPGRSGIHHLERLGKLEVIDAAGTRRLNARSGEGGPR